MPVETASWAAVFAPALITFAVVGVLPGLLPMRQPWVRGMIVGVILTIMCRYLYWRATDTLILENGGVALWSLFCFTVELLAAWDGALLFLAFLRTSDRSVEADQGEERVRALPPGEVPSVDILIPTYDESLEVLEKTIIGALSLDWPNASIFVLDDCRRPWLRDYCQAKGVGYITRPDNQGAKAGNINHALTRTSGDFVAIFDADFVPQRAFLMRAMGFFEDPKVGIVQIPHAFYNHDPLQTNLDMRKSLPDDQRFFFESIMPSRDGWDAAFCCGSNSVTRRSALDLAGGALPEGSITEDMLLSLVLLRKGYITRYLCERLAYGLAPETVSAFFVQRQRWARGAIQILYLRAGPLGPGLKLIQRLLFLPTHWFTQALMTLVTLLVPIVFLLTGLPPMQHTTPEAVAFYLAPVLIAVFGGLVAFAPGRYHPLAAQVLGTFQSFKLLPTIIATFIQPHGHAFKVTPKGANAAGEFERGIFLTCLTLILLTVTGIVVNVTPEWRRVDDVALIPMVAFWCAVNIAVLFLVSLLCLQMPVRRGEERFALTEPVLLRRSGAGGVARVSIDMSLSGLALQAEGDTRWRVGEPVQLYISAVGWLPGVVARASQEMIGVRFDGNDCVERDLLIRKLFTSGQNTAADNASTFDVALGMLKRIWSADMRIRAVPAPKPAEVPALENLERLPARSYVVPPTRNPTELTKAVARMSRAA